MCLKIGIITASDRASSGVYDDKSGKAIMEVLNEYLKTNPEYDYRVIPDEQEEIQNTIVDMSNNQCSLIVTTGGTGPY